MASLRFLLAARYFSGCALLFFSFAASADEITYYFDSSTENPVIGLAVIEGNAVFGPANNLVIDIAGTAPITEHDVVQVGGTAILNGTLTVVLHNGFLPQGGDSFTFLTAGSISGTFANLNLPTVAAGEWQLTVDATSATLSIPAAADPKTVPLPVEILILLGAILTTIAVKLNVGAAPYHQHEVAASKNFSGRK